MGSYAHALLGGMLIGASAVFLLIANGRAAGISGIVGRLLGGHGMVENAAFLAGLVLGPLAFAAWNGAPPAIAISTSWPFVVLAGLLVGFGTRMGSGCTSGHGIIGLARLSPRSIAATATFLAAGLLTASLTGWLR